MMNKPDQLLDAQADLLAEIALHNRRRLVDQDWFLPRQCRRWNGLPPCFLLAWQHCAPKKTSRAKDPACQCYVTY